MLCNGSAYTTSNEPNALQTLINTVTKAAPTSLQYGMKNRFGYNQCITPYSTAGYPTKVVNFVSFCFKRIQEININSTCCHRKK